MIVIPGVAIRDNEVALIAANSEKIVIFLTTTWGTERLPVRVTVDEKAVSMTAGAEVLFHGKIDTTIFNEAVQRIRSSLLLKEKQSFRDTGAYI
ncbi:MAG: hypothetical protein GY861_22290 [bacterium]|nr:hypothetical protein [bacterium]